MPYYPRTAFIDGTGTNAIAAAHTADTATASATNSLAVGHAASVSTNDGVAIGSGATVQTNVQAVAVGGGSAISTTAAPLASGICGIAIGSTNSATQNGARATGTASTAIGPGDQNNAAANCAGAWSMALGHHTVVASGHNNSVALGAVAATTAANQIMLGTSAETVVHPGAVSIDGVVMSGAWTSYTPALTASTTNPTLGTGSITTGKYIKIGRTVIGWFIIYFGSSGTAAGTGTYQVSFPVTPAASATDHITIGHGYLYNGTILHLYSLFQASGSSVMVGLLDSSTAVSFVTASVPWTWGANNRILGNFQYEAST
jgi:hypothetical protein